MRKFTLTNNTTNTTVTFERSGNVFRLLKEYYDNYQGYLEDDTWYGAVSQDDDVYRLTIKMEDI